MLINTLIKVATSDRERMDIAKFRQTFHSPNPTDEEFPQFLMPKDQSHLFYATIKNKSAYDEQQKIVGSLSINWLKDSPQEDHTINAYDLNRFSIIAKEKMAIWKQFLIIPEEQGSFLPYQLLSIAVNFALQNDISLIFHSCPPHFLSLYESLGFRNYTKTVNNPKVGLMLPMILILEDESHLKKVNSSFLSLMQDKQFDTELSDQINTLIPPDQSAVQHLKDSSSIEWVKLYGELTERNANKISIFEDIPKDELNVLLKKSHLIECSRGDQIIRKGSVERSIFIILSGITEVRINGHVTAILYEGDILGEICFLLGTERMADVFAVTDDVRILSISQEHLQKLMKSDPTIAARLMHNLAKIVSHKLVDIYKPDQDDRIASLLEPQIK